MSQLSEELEAVEAILMEGIERQEDGDKIERVRHTCGERTYEHVHRTAGD